MSSASPPNPSGDDRKLWIQLADPVARTITIFLALITAITRFRCWHTSLLLRCFLNLAKKPLYQLLGSAVLIGIGAERELYVVWAVLLFTGFGTFFSIVDYSIHTSNKRKLMQNNELMQLSNNLTVLLLILAYPDLHDQGPDDNEVSPDCHKVPNGHGVFTAPLWTIWGLSLIKIFCRMCSFYFVDRLYGSANNKLVALHMKREQNIDSFDPETMMGYKYLLLGEKPAEVGRPPIYEIQVNIDDAITIERVWQCEGSLLSAGNRSERLKDTCLPFALFKMLNRRFEEECDTADSDRPKTRGFICRGLLTFPTERVFRVIDMEVKFLQELFYTKYPAIFGFGFPWMDMLLFVSNMSTFVFTFLELQQYKDPDRKIDCQQIKGDVTVTKFILSVVMIMEVWEFIRYFLSDWSKVLMVCQYVNKWKILDLLLIDKVLWVLCSIYLGGHTINKIGQISLLDLYRTSCGNCINRASCGIMWDYVLQENN